MTDTNAENIIPPGGGIIIITAYTLQCRVFVANTTPGQLVGIGSVFILP